MPEELTHNGSLSLSKITNKLRQVTSPFPTFVAGIHFAFLIYNLAFNKMEEPQFVHNKEEYPPMHIEEFDTYQT